MMKTHQILCCHTGECSTTSKDPVALWTGQVDLSEKRQCILNSDDFRPVSVNKWEVRNIELPDWMSPEEWIRNGIEWKYNWGAGVQVDWPEAWQRGLLSLSMAQRMACVNLLKVKKFRSEFRASLRERLEKWLETPFDLRTYSSPFSDRQWDCLIDVRLRRLAESTSTSLYRNR